MPRLHVFKKNGRGKKTIGVVVYCDDDDDGDGREKTYIL